MNYAPSRIFSSTLSLVVSLSTRRDACFPSAQRLLFHPANTSVSLVALAPISAAAIHGFCNQPTIHNNNHYCTCTCTSTKGCDAAISAKSREFSKLIQRGPATYHSGRVSSRTRNQRQTNELRRGAGVGVWRRQHWG